MHDFQDATGEALPELLQSATIWSGHRTSTRPATTHGPNRASSKPPVSDGSPKKKLRMEANHIEGSRPRVELVRLVWILGKLYFKFTESMTRRCPQGCLGPKQNCLMYFSRTAWPGSSFR
jgi:hypothetical protein